jgi:hypothetical protein
MVHTLLIKFYIHFGIPQKSHSTGNVVFKYAELWLKLGEVKKCKSDC